jgi:hypothetical protein
MTLINQSELSPGIVSATERSEELIVSTTRFDDTDQRPGGIVSGPSCCLLLTQSRSWLPWPIQRRVRTVSQARSQCSSSGPLTSERSMSRNVCLNKYGKRSCVDATVFSDGQDQPAAQGVVTYVPIFP